MYIEQNIIAVGDPIDESSLEQIRRCASLVQEARLLADHHKGYSCPIGGVMADPDKFSIASVGYDIACGVKAARTNLTLEDVKDDMSSIMDEVVRQVSFGIGQNNNVTVDHPLFDSDQWKMDACKSLKQMARNQLGTVGSGNHYVNVFADESDVIWVGCHFGSRGLGHKITTFYLQAIGANDNMDAYPAMMEARSMIGEEYLAAIDLAGQYAYAGRDWVCQTVADILGANIEEEIHLHHNFLWLEEHNGQKLWVGRKGSTPAFPGQKGMIGATMCEPSVIFEGCDSEFSKELLYSTVHGAGRQMSRTEARGKTNRRTGELLLNEDGQPKSTGKVTPEMMREWVEQSGIQLRGADRDESPHAYKRLPGVLAHHEGTIEILHELRPLGVAMAGKDVRDPYVD